MKMRTYLFLWAVLLLIVAAACANMPPQQQAAVATGVVASAASIWKLLTDAGVLTPEQSQQMQQYVQAFGESAQAWAQLFTQMMQPTAELKREVAQLQANQWTTEDLAKLASGSAAAGAAGGAALIRAVRGPSATIEERAERTRKRAKGGG